MPTSLACTYDPALRLLTTELIGTVTVADAERWNANVGSALAAIPDGTSFRWLSNMHGYEPADLNAHKGMRATIPSALVRHGFLTGYFALTNMPPVPLHYDRGVVCAAIAHVHHDLDKMARYREKIASPTEDFFTDLAAARAWVLTR
ncbi:MAG: hypothetical protein FJX64_02165 [Alphaproteobacteria bacterium]|nr:hypothetical protein [Alphaproteobacteria bacterium]